jgi:hypothetical protein
MSKNEYSHCRPALYGYFFFQNLFIKEARKIMLSKMDKMVLCGKNATFKVISI